MTNDAPRADADLVRALSMEARVLKQARLIPGAGKLTPQHYVDVRRALGEYTQANNINQAQLAREIDRSAATISQWLSGQYVGDVDAITRALNAWMERDARRRLIAAEVDYLPTQVCEEMRAVISAGMQIERIVVLVAPSGSGKSMLLKAMAKETSGFYLRAKQEYSAKAFLVALAELVKASPKGSAGAVADAIIAQLKGTRLPIYIDEAQTLKPHHLGTLRMIYDEAGVPIVMAGAQTIRDKVQDRVLGLGQMASRCLYYDAWDFIHNAESPTGSRLGRPLYTEAEVEEFIARLGVRLEPDALQLAWGLACLPNHGTFRLLRTVLDQIRIVADLAKPITRRQIQQSLTMQLSNFGNVVFAHATRHVENFKKATA